MELGYYDVHTHILPQVDDGAEDMNETLEMIKIAYFQGIRTMFATPHYACGDESLEVEQLLEIYIQVKEKIFSLYPDFNLLLGNELYYSPSILDDLKCKRALTLADSHYVLVEFSPAVDYKLVYKGLKELVLAGYQPILAHMERYECLYRKPERLLELQELGVYYQMNASSLNGKLLDSRANWCRKQVLDGWIQFLGSDAHSSRTRSPKIDNAVKWLHNKCNPKLVEEILYTNPQSILEDKIL